MRKPSGASSHPSRATWRLIPASSRTLRLRCIHYRRDIRLLEALREPRSFTLGPLYRFHSSLLARRRIRNTVTSNHFDSLDFAPEPIQGLHLPESPRKSKIKIQKLCTRICTWKLIDPKRAVLRFLSPFQVSFSPSKTS